VTRASSRRILIVHNHYRQRGGEDAVVESEATLLRRFGHDVHVYSRHNDEIAAIGAARAARETIWSGRASGDVARILANGHFDIVHVHNTFPLISPSVYWAAGRAQVPVVQTLHNFRLLCPQGTFLRRGLVCEDCLGHVPWRGALHACYRGSSAQSSVLAAMLTYHRLAGTWNRRIARYVALSEFSRKKFVEGGLPEHVVRVKPNFVAHVEVPPGLQGARAANRQGGLFIGRLSGEKGITVLLKALDVAPDLVLDVVGDGPEFSRVSGHSGVRAHGLKPPDEVTSHLHRAAYLVLPSICYEQFPRTLVEAFASGLPVIASRLGPLPELVEDGRTGLLFRAGDASDLAAKLAWAEANPDAMRRMGESARAVYETCYTPERNHDLLMTIYDEAIEEGRRRDR
jgi:glycosyltransferase involved in cell wall biosynthesis